jgi:hypothetical protein
MFFSNFKKIIEPLQNWLLSSGRCVGCGKEIAKSENRKTKGAGEELVTCDCRRVYVFNKKKAAYRRALLNEIK